MNIRGWRKFDISPPVVGVKAWAAPAVIITAMSTVRSKFAGPAIARTAAFLNNSRSQERKRTLPIGTALLCGRKRCGASRGERRRFRAKRSFGAFSP